MINLSQQFSGFSASAQHIHQAANNMEEHLRMFGPTSRVSFKCFSGLAEYLMPLKSFPTRFGIIGYGDWSLIVSDMRDEYCLSDARILSKAGSCIGMNVVALPNRREFALFESGAKIRQVQSLDDGRWYYRELGPLQPFEDIAENIRRPKRNRLSEKAVKEYFSSVTGLNWPSWTGELFGEIIGIPRSFSELRQPIVSFETRDDLCHGHEAQRDDSD